MLKCPKCGNADGDLIKPYEDEVIPNLTELGYVCKVCGFEEVKEQVETSTLNISKK